MIVIAVLLLASVAPSSAAETPCITEADRRSFGNLCRYREENGKLLQASSHPRVVMIGDSITEGWIAADPTVFRDGVVHRGISGETTGQMLVRFRQDVIELKPRAVHIMGGTNDIFGNVGTASVDEVVSNIRSMGKLASGHGMRVIIGSVLPASRDGAPVTAVDELNRKLAALAQSEGYEFVDYYRALDKGDGSMAAINSGDGVHPTEAGYARMRPLAVKAIASVR